MIRITLALVIAVAGHLQTGSELALMHQLSLIGGHPFETVYDYAFYYGSLPRTAMAILIGAALGISGSLLQQLTGNRLLSPMTLGTASGAWLTLLITTLCWPVFAASHPDLAALAGAGIASSLVFLIAGRSGLSGLPVVLAGMAVNLLLGALASALVLLNDQYAQPLFVWSSGDLAQNDWHQVLWLLPRLLPIVPILIVAPRALTLLRIGEGNASARGLSMLPVFFLLLTASLWLSAISVASVGLLGFIGLLAPNLARIAGARTALGELLGSLWLGPLLLLSTDAMAQLSSSQAGYFVPSGAASALIGAPVLIWLLKQKRQGEITAPAPRVLRPPASAPRVTAIAMTALLLALLFGALIDRDTDGWQLQFPSEVIWQLRWPGLIAVIAAGSGLAVSGTILQRLIRNPLASPEILGISAGASLAIVLTMLLGIQGAGMLTPLAAFSGALIVLGLLLFFGLRSGFAPSQLALVGICLAALVEALLQFVLAQGGDDTFKLLAWLQGSTQGVDAHTALWLASGVALCLIPALLSQRALTLLSLGATVASARGLGVQRARMALLVLASLICALVTAGIGPLAFVGLLAPHLASLLGARSIRLQLIVAALIGSAILLLAAGLGRTLLVPNLMPVGTLSAIIGGGYFIYLLSRRRLVTA
ncbi:MAG: Fe(3+)-hydroxamate ABC transporter permease FhuB [Oceanospirillales bacterium]|nr:Fe(3+)-hydroxamate ABC transporter permease FhuB [Oceanospirillales bacterium]